MQMPEYHFSRYVFVVTGMSYIIDSSGTSKVVKAHLSLPVPDAGS